MSALLTVEDLHVHFVARDREDRERTARALNGISFTLARGEILGLVGETGAGKSLTATAVMGLLRSPARLVRGSIRFDGMELAGAPDAEVNRLRGGRMALVVQSPKTSLDPLSRIGGQIARVHRAHRNVTPAAARERALAMLEAVGIPDAARRMAAWPHQLSGGMAQRVLIAMALVNDPDMLIADEPTTGLDVTVQAQILDLLREKARERQAATMIITHDLGVVAHYCDRMMVMFAGTVVESGPVQTVFAAPRHPYTRTLLAASPDRVRPGESVPPAGQPPNLYDLPPGCPYAPRCAFATAACATPPPMHVDAMGHAVQCHHPQEAA
jgi:peptide/nickel transport system ATP-binding protein/oligopeptide transport system ATP-binding protein